MSEQSRSHGAAPRITRARVGFSALIPELRPDGLLRMALRHAGRAVADPDLAARP
jgi:hypothetical protein